MGAGRPLLDPDDRRAPQREHSLREVLNGLRWIVRAGAAWRMIPPDLPPWHTVYQQSQRWLKAGVFDAIVQELRAVLRLAQGRHAAPAAAIVESRTGPSPPARGTRAGEDGANRRRGSQVPMAGETLGPLVAAPVTAAAEQARSQVSPLAAQGQEVTGEAVARALVDQGYTGAQAAAEAPVHQRQLDVVKWPEATKGCGLLPKRWVVERSKAWAARFRRLARDDERLAETRAGWHFVACAIRRLKRFVECIV